MHLKMLANLFRLSVLERKVNYRQVSNIRRTLVGNWIVDHSDALGASPIGDLVRFILESQRYA